MLEAFFNPDSVAIIGASRTPGKLGYAVVDNLISSGFTGKVYPINLKADEILDRKAYPSVLDVPGDIDLAVVVIPAKYVAGALKECGEKGIGYAIIISAGFRETGHEGLEMEMELIEIAEKYDMRIVGPNCLGFMDTYAPSDTSFAPNMPPKGPIAFMSQSGALGTAILDWSIGTKQVGFSKFMSIGNKADVSEIDLLQALEDDENTKVILSYTEGLADGQEFMKIASSVSKHKPVIMLKSGVTASGSKAVSSHTGSLAGAREAYAAAFAQAGVLQAHTLTEMFDFAKAFAYQPLLQGDNIAIVTNAGGPGVLTTDEIEGAGLKLADMKPETIGELEKGLPAAASALNPVDVLGDALADRYEHALELVVEDPNVDGIIVIVTPQAMTEVEKTAEAVGKIAKKTEKPILGCFIGNALTSAGVEVMREYGVPNYEFPEGAVSAFKAMKTYRGFLNRPESAVVEFDVDKGRVQKVIDQVAAEGRSGITELEAREIQLAYDIPMPPSELAKDAEAAAKAAAEIGFPVVMKIASPDILHKTDAGGVKVGVKDEAEAKAAFEEIIANAKDYKADAEIWGCLVQKMADKGIVEVLVGMTTDPQFGPLVTFGLGGIYVEVLKDVTFRVAPFTKHQAKQMIGEIKTHELLEGFRGDPVADKAAIADVLMRIGQLVTDFPQIKELDINPLLVYPEGKGALALDMRLIIDAE
jgi:acetyltransferase